MFGTFAPCEIAISEMNTKGTGGSTYHLQIKVHAVVL